MGPTQWPTTSISTFTSIFDDPWGSLGSSSISHTASAQCLDPVVTSVIRFRIPFCTCWISTLFQMGVHSAYLSKLFNTCFWGFEIHCPIWITSGPRNQRIQQTLMNNNPAVQKRKISSACSEMRELKLRTFDFLFNLGFEKFPCCFVWVSRNFLVAFPLISTCVWYYQ